MLISIFYFIVCCYQLFLLCPTKSCSGDIFLNSTWKVEMSTQDLLFQLINESNPHKHPLTGLDVSIGAPQLDISTTKNSKIQLTAKPGSGYSGSVWIIYSRESMGNVHLPTQILSEVAFTVNSILAAINQKLLVPVTLADLDPFTLPLLNVGDILTLNLSASSGSLAWISGTTISLLYGLPPNIDDVFNIFNLELPVKFPPK